MGFISKFLLPKQVDFDAAMLEQARVARQMVEQLRHLGEESEAMAALAHRGARLKARNMRELLDVFITPYDKESIYRMITQLDWIALSVKHFHVEAGAYGVSPPTGWEKVLERLRAMAAALEAGLTQLGDPSLTPLVARIDRIHELYDEVVAGCAGAVAALDESQGCKVLLLQRDLLLQLKEIARRIQVAANTLEDMAIKRL